MRRISVQIHQLPLQASDRSGSHDDFTNFVGTRAYLKNYWNLLNETDDAMLSSFATAELPEEVIKTSLQPAKKRMSSMNVMASNVKKTRINFDQRRTEAIESMAKSMSDYYKHLMMSDNINNKSVEEQIEFYEDNWNCIR